MINKLVVDGQNITLNESTVLPFTYTFSTSGVHSVRVGLDNTNEICAYAFMDCEDLTKVNSIPERITMIKRSAFENCSKLSKFDVPSSIEYIGPNVFDGCDSLREIKFNSTTPPRFYSTLSDSTTCYIPDYSKYVKVEDNSTLVRNGDVQYYEKNVLGGYDEVDYEALDDEGEYYYDNWTDVHDHYNVIEERFRVPVNQIQFIDEGVATTLYGDINAGDEGDIFDYQFIPSNCTNQNVYIYSSNEKILQVDQNGHFTSYAGLLGNANANIIICTEPNYNGTYAFTQLRFRIRATQPAPEQVDMTLAFPENYSLDISDVVIGDDIEFTTPTLSGDSNLTDPEFTYESTNEGVAKFTGSTLKVVGAGSTTITITYDGDAYHKSASASFELSISNVSEPQEEQTYTIIFKDGDEVLKTITGPSGTSVSASDIDLTKDGYEFNGWSLDGTSPILPVDTIIDTNLTYVALWIEEGIYTEFETDENGNTQLLPTGEEESIDTEFETDENGNTQLLPNDEEEGIDTEFESDENGNTQLLPGEEESIDTEFESDGEGNTQVINSNS